MYNIPNPNPDGLETLIVYLIYCFLLLCCLAFGAWLCDVVEAWEHKKKQDKLVKQGWKQ